MPAAQHLILVVVPVGCSRSRRRTSLREEDEWIAGGVWLGSVESLWGAVPIMIDTGDKHLIAQANRNGYFYVLDRTTGKLLSASPYGKVTWSDTEDAEGRPLAKKGS